MCVVKAEHMTNSSRGLAESESVKDIPDDGGHTGHIDSRFLRDKLLPINIKPSVLKSARETH